MKKILIVDDERPILEMYKAALTGYEVLLSENGEEALELARKEQPNLIYLDIIMPKINGLDVLSKLKGEKITKDIPVVVLTNLPEEASKDKAQSLGANGYFVKALYEPEKIAEETKKTLGE